jgi:hypothetical protein
LGPSQSSATFEIETRLTGVDIAETVFESVMPLEHKGKTGIASWRTLEVGNVRVRMVEYTPSYFADHWCTRGHVLLVMEGELQTELQDRRKFKLTTGKSYQVATDAEPHRSSTTIGAKLFIVD